MAAISDRKRAANQANAQKSTGPKTEEGKRKARMNALKHGLRAEEVVLPGEDAAAFEAELAAWFDDWKPQSRARAVLVERAAVQAWRLRRCVRVETATLAAIEREAAETFDRQVATRVGRGLDLLDTDPRRAFELLLDDPDGIAALIGLWTDLVNTLAEPGSWTDPDAHHGRLLTLLGHRADADAAETGEDEPLAAMSLRLIAANDPDAAADPEGPLAPEVARRVEALMIDLAENRLAGLRAELAEFEDRVAYRARRIEAACFDDSDRGRTLQRYEATLDRSLRATIAQLVAMAKSGINEAELEAAPLVATNEVGAPIEPTEPLAQAPPARSTSPAPPNGPTATPPESPSAVVGRDRGGRIWAVEGDGPDVLHR